MCRTRIRRLQADCDLAPCVAGTHADVILFEFPLPAVWRLGTRCLNTVMSGRFAYICVGRGLQMGSSTGKLEAGLLEAGEPRDGLCGTVDHRHSQYSFAMNEATYGYNTTSSSLPLHGRPAMFRQLTGGWTRVRRLCAGTLLSSGPCIIPCSLASSGRCT